jgi:hypothetical protein
VLVDFGPFVPGAHAEPASSNTTQPVTTITFAVGVMLKDAGTGPCSVGAHRRKGKAARFIVESVVLTRCFSQLLGKKDIGGVSEFGYH